MSISVKVSEYDDLRGHVEYTIEIKDTNGEAWCFKRRYSALRFFHELIKKSEKRVPSFPPKKIFGNFNPDFLEIRKKQIEQYFLSLTRIPEIVHSQAFKDFIKPFDKAPILKNKKNQKKLFTKEVNDAIAQIIAKNSEEASLEFIRLSPVFPMDAQDIEKLSNQYSDLLLNLKINFESFLVKSIPENLSKLKKPKQPSSWIEKVFKESLDSYQEADINA
jgi:PX domain